MSKRSLSPRPQHLRSSRATTTTTGIFFDLTEQIDIQRRQDECEATCQTWLEQIQTQINNIQTQTGAHLHKHAATETATCTSTVTETAPSSTSTSTSSSSFYINSKQKKTHYKKKTTSTTTSTSTSPSESTALSVSSITHLRIRPSWSAACIDHVRYAQCSTCHTNLIVSQQHGSTYSPMISNSQKRAPTTCNERTTSSYATPTMGWTNDTLKVLASILPHFPSLTSFACDISHLPIIAPALQRCAQLHTLTIYSANETAIWNTCCELLIQLFSTSQQQPLDPVTRNEITSHLMDVGLPLSVITSICLPLIGSNHVGLSHLILSDDLDSSGVINRYRMESIIEGWQKLYKQNKLTLTHISRCPMEPLDEFMNESSQTSSHYALLPYYWRTRIRSTFEPAEWQPLWDKMRTFIPNIIQGVILPISKPVSTPEEVKQQTCAKVIPTPPS